jgi:hypothetical protein
MDLCWLEYLSKEFIGIGKAPTPQEILAIKASAPILCQKHGHDACHFWGKVRGTARSYLILACYTDGLLGDKTFYASLDGISWFGLPLVTQNVLFHCSHIRTPITGNPLTKTPVRHPRKPVAFKEFPPLIPPKPKPEEEEEEEEEQPEKDEKEEEEEKDEEEELPEYEEFMITEDQRVAYVIHLIENKGYIFPQDALLWKDGCHVAVNPLFKGPPEDVKLDDFCRLDKLCPPDQARENQIIETMPLLSEDLPARGWHMSKEARVNVIKITSTTWPGLTFIAKGEKWGTVYLGSGVRNVDFLFTTE